MPLAHELASALLNMGLSSETSCRMVTVRESFCRVWTRKFNLLKAEAQVSLCRQEITSKVRTKEEPPRN